MLPLALLAATTLTLGGSAAGLPAASTLSSSAAVAACAPDSASSNDAARVRDGVKGAAEPKLYPENQAKAYGVLNDAPRIPNGSVHINTVFHMVSDHVLSAAERTRWQTLINAQMTVLNDSFAGRTAPDASDSPFRFDLTRHLRGPSIRRGTTVEPGKGIERDMKSALYEGDSDDVERLRRRHRWRAARLGVLPQGLQQRA